MDKPEIFVTSQVRDVISIACNQIIQRDNFMSLSQKTVTEMRTEETGSTGD